MRAVLTAALILWASIASAQVADFYEVAGESADGKPYVGILTAEKQENGTYALQWELEAGDSAVGIAIVDGPAAAVIFQTESGQIGLVLWKKVGEEWQGQWSGPGAPGIYGEVLRPSKKSLEQLRKNLKAKQGPRSQA